MRIADVVDHHPLKCTTATINLYRFGCDREARSGLTVRRTRIRSLRSVFLEGP
jgi:hypothetical protein